MAILSAINYDPAEVVSKVCTNRLAMTALDTTNLRATFTAPANGAVTVRLRCTVAGATTMPSILLGVMSGSTVVARQCPIGGVPGTALTTTRITQEALFTVPGLTPSSEYVWDAAYGVEILLSGVGIKYGSPNASGSIAWGGFQYEIYSTPNLLGAVMYDPSTAVIASGSALKTMTALDATNLRLTFTAPASGKVLYRMRAPVSGSVTFPQIMYGVMSGSNVISKVTPIGGLKTTAVATAQLALEGQAVVTGLASGSSYTWDAAYGVQTLVGSTGVKYGGPNNTTTNDAWGGFCYEIWSV